MPKFLDYNPEQVYLLPPSVRDDLAFRYLAAGAAPDFWTLNDFRRRHGRALNDLFTQVVELARSLGMGRLGHVAIDSTRLAANASPNRVETIDALRAERARIRRQIRRWQRQCDSDDPHEAAGQQLAPEHIAAFQQRLQEIPRRLEQLRKAGRTRASLTDPDSRFLRDRRGFTLGYTATVAVSEDHLMVELAQRGVDAYVPDSTLARELNRGPRVRGGAPVCHPVHRRMRQKLRSPTGRAIYQRRKAIVEPVIGVLKEQRGMRRFRRRGLAKVAVELALAATAFNLTRLWRVHPALQGAQ